MSTGLKSGPPKRTAVLIAYYEGAYGPTIRIDVQSLDGLAEIKAVFERLSSGQFQQFSMSELKSVALEPPLKSVILLGVSGSWKAARRRQVRQAVSADGKLIFEWSQTACEWDDTISLVEGLWEAGTLGKSGHQYLTDESGGGVLVELALKE